MPASGGNGSATAHYRSPILSLFRLASKAGARLLREGPDAGREVEEAAAEARKLRARIRIAMRYEPPEGFAISRAHCYFFDP